MLMDEPGPNVRHTLPCGAESFWDECGWRCLDCLTIYGSIACPCSNKNKDDWKRKEDNE